MVTDTNREYELVVIVSHEADEDETATALEMFTNFISDHGGSVSSREDWGIKRLAYPIKNYREGNYVLFKFDLSPDDINELDGIIGSSQNIIRHLVTVATGSSKEEEEQSTPTDQEESGSDDSATEQSTPTDQEESGSDDSATKQVTQSVTKDDPKD